MTIIKISSHLTIDLDSRTLTVDGVRRPFPRRPWAIARAIHRGVLAGGEPLDDSGVRYTPTAGGLEVSVDEGHTVSLDHREVYRLAELFRIAGVQDQREALFAE